MSCNRGKSNRLLAGDHDERFPNLVVEPQHRSNQDLPTRLLLIDRPPKILLGFILRSPPSATQLNLLDSADQIDRQCPWNPSESSSGYLCRSYAAEACLSGVQPLNCLPNRKRLLDNRAVQYRYTCGRGTTTSFLHLEPAEAIG